MDPISHVRECLPFEDNWALYLNPQILFLSRSIEIGLVFVLLFPYAYWYIRQSINIYLQNNQGGHIYKTYK
jgi:hypothetical protein